MCILTLLFGANYFYPIDNDDSKYSKIKLIKDLNMSKLYTLNYNCWIKY